MHNELAILLRVLKLTIFTGFFIGNGFQSAVARELKFEKKIDPGALQSQLVASGFKVNWIECSVNHCKIVLPDSEKKDPMPIVQKYVYVDARDARRKNMEALQALYDKWQAGTITNEEKDQLIKQAIGMMLAR